MYLKLEIFYKMWFGDNLPPTPWITYALLEINELGFDTIEINLVFQQLVLYTNHIKNMIFIIFIIICLEYSTAQTEDKSTQW